MKKVHISRVYFYFLLNTVFEQKKKRPTSWALWQALRFYYWLFRKQAWCILSPR
jgi:hypothetical protein